MVAVIVLLFSLVVLSGTASVIAHEFKSDVAMYIEVVGGGVCLVSAWLFLLTTITFVFILGGLV